MKIIHVRILCNFCYKSLANCCSAVYLFQFQLLCCDDVVDCSSMIEMSTYHHHHQQSNYHRHLTSSQAEVNPGAPELLAQLFWTGASLLESDYLVEYTMALRLLSKVCTVHI